MLNFRFLTLVYFVSLATCVLSLEGTILFAALAGNTLIFLGIASWGALSVCSQLYLPAICRGSALDDSIAITFDDGPDAQKTPAILDLLNKYQAKATFFVIGSKCSEQEAILQRIYEEGHLIGNHGFSHSSAFPLFSPSKIRKELRVTCEKIEAITGEKNLYFRPPFGVTNPLISKALQGLNLITIGWTVRSLDTIIKDPEKVIKRVTEPLKPGKIVLLHDTTPDILLILEKTLEYCKERGWKAVRVDQLV